jgi:hypothetical protein
LCASFVASKQEFAPVDAALDVGYQTGGNIILSTLGRAPVRVTEVGCETVAFCTKYMFSAK